jgi:hypothetical protein
MSNYLRELTLEEIAALKNALALVLVETKKKSGNIDAATNDPSQYDALHALYMPQRIKWPKTCWSCSMRQPASKSI